jgi:hypothetical protein
LAPQTLGDLVSPVPGLQVRVCNYGDLVCQPPGLAEGVTDPSGQVSLGPFKNASRRTNAGVNGYLEIDSGDSGVLPTLFFRGFPLSEKEWLHTYRGFETLNAYQSGWQSAGVTVDPDEEMLVAVVWDCLQAPAAGRSEGILLQVERSLGTRQFTVNNAMNFKLDWSHGRQQRSVVHAQEVPPSPDPNVHAAEAEQPPPPASSTEQSESSRHSSDGVWQ